MSDQKNNSSLPKNSLTTLKLTGLDLMAEEHITVSQGLQVAAECTPGPEADDYRRLSKLFRLMAIVLIFQEQMDDNKLISIERDLAAIGLPGIFAQPLF